MEESKDCENLVSEKSLGFGFGKFGLGFNFGDFSLGKKNPGFKKFGLEKIFFLVSENLVSEIKNQNNKKEIRPSKQCKFLFEF